MRSTRCVYFFSSFCLFNFLGTPGIASVFCEPAVPTPALLTKQASQRKLPILEGSSVPSSRIWWQEVGLLPVSLGRPLRTFSWEDSLKTDSENPSVLQWCCHCWQFRSQWREGRGNKGVKYDLWDVTWSMFWLRRSKSDQELHILTFSLERKSDYQLPHI